MAKSDHYELERAREARHEARWRLMGTCHLKLRHNTTPEQGCRIRRCRRNRMCSGPMIATPRQGQAITRERDLGLSGVAVACLPRCMVNLDDELFELHAQNTLTQLEEALFGHPPRLLRRIMSPDRAHRRFLGGPDDDEPDP